MAASPATKTVVDGFEGLAGVYQGVADQFEAINFRPALEKTAKYLSKLHAGYFRSEAGPAGPWLPWHFRSLSAPAEHPTLRVSGRLAASLEGGSDHVEEYTGDGGSNQGLAWGTAVPYAGIHQAGASFTTGIPLVSRTGGFLPAGSRITIPARPHVGLTEESVKPILEYVADHAVQSLKKG